MVLHDHETKVDRILFVLMGLFLLYRTLSSGFWRSFNFQAKFSFIIIKFIMRDLTHCLKLVPLSFVMAEN